MKKQIKVHMSKLSQSHQSPHLVPDFFDKPVCSPFWYDTTRNRGQHKVQHHSGILDCKWRPVSSSISLGFTGPLTKTG